MENTNDTLPTGCDNTNIAKAIIKVMQEVRNIEKGLTVGTGNNSYKGVADKDVKYALSDAMAKNGLCILPIGINAVETVTRWDQGGFQKQSVFTKVDTKYLLLHESGESIEIVGHGHGVDSQDKSAGKATTYALKYALLYTFMVATGNIDDADKESSEAHEVPKVAAKKNVPPNKPNATKEIVENYCAAIMNGEIGMYEEVFEKYVVGTGGKKLLDEAKAKHKQLSGELS
jgi:hypothetical protein